MERKGVAAGGSTNRLHGKDCLCSSTTQYDMYRPSGVCIDVLRGLWHLQQWGRFMLGLDKFSQPFEETGASATGLHKPAISGDHQDLYRDLGIVAASPFTK